KQGREPVRLRALPGKLPGCLGFRGSVRRERGLAVPSSRFYGLRQNADRHRQPQRGTQAGPTSFHKRGRFKFGTNTRAWLSFRPIRGSMDAIGLLASLEHFANGGDQFFRAVLFGGET